MENQTALEEYLLDLKLRNCSPRTIKTMENNMTLFFNWVKLEHDVTQIEDVRRNHIKGYFQYKQSLGLKPTYLNGILKNMKAFFNYLNREEYLEINPATKITYQREEKVIIQTFEPAEVKRMIGVYGFANFLDVRNRCIITMLFDTGIRNLELCNIKCEDVKGRTILIHGKGNKQRLVPISPLLRKTMLRYEMKREKYIKERYQDEYYFLSQNGRMLTVEAIGKVVKECGRAAHVNEQIRCSPHTCRHTFAQMSLRNGIDIYTLSRILGHENISITKRYLQSMKDDTIIEMALEHSPLMNL